MVIHLFRNSFQLGLHENHVYDFDTIWLKKNRHTVFPCETQNVVFVLLVNIESPFHQHIPCDIVVVFGYLRLINKTPIHVGLDVGPFIMLSDFCGVW